jgi:hypothetical protein
MMFKDREVIREHLVRSGFMDNYFIWTKHGETRPGTESIIDERAEENMGIPDDVCSHIITIDLRMIYVRMMQITMMKVLM